MTPGFSEQPLTLADSLSAEQTRGAALDELIVMKGICHVQLFENGIDLKEERLVDNTITTVGRNSIVDQLLASPTLGKPTHMEVGTSNTGAPGQVTDTTITGGFGRVALTSKTRSTNVLTMVGDWGAGASTGTLQEAGVWDASTAGTLWARATYTAIVKGANDTLKITWTWTIG